MKTKKIYRSTENVIIAGVCAGLADYFEIDETLVRIIFVLLAIGGGSGVLIYFILWLVIPEEENMNKFTDDVGDKTKTMAKEIKKEVKVEKIKPEKKRGSFFGLLLILWGGILLVEKIAPRLINWDYFWPATLIFLGSYLMLQR